MCGSTASVRSYLGSIKAFSEFVDFSADGLEPMFRANSGQQLLPGTSQIVVHETRSSKATEITAAVGEWDVALCVSLHRPNAKGDDRNVHGHLFMTTRVVDADGNFSKSKIRDLDDRKLGPVEIERMREMWEVRCNRALRKAGVSETVSRHSLKTQGVDRPATKHLGAKATAMTRNGCRMRKAEINELISSDCRRLAEVNSQLNRLRTHDRKTRRQIRERIENLDLAAIRQPHQSKSKRQTYGVAVSAKSRRADHRNRPARNRARSRPARPYAGRELARLPCRRSFNRTNCSRPSLPGRSTPCRAPANPTNCHPSTRNRTAATTAAFWNPNEDVSGVEIA